MSPKSGYRNMVLIAVVLALSSIGVPAHAIVNPDPALSASAPPAVVALHDERVDLMNELKSSDLREKNTQYCTGTLVAPRWVLTAAHCLHGKANRYVTTFVDGVKLRRDVVKVHVHPLYADNRRMTKFDVGLMLLDSPLTGVTPIPILNKSDAGALSAPEGLMLYGWGMVLRGKGWTLEEFFSRDDSEYPRPIAPSRPKAVRQFVYAGPSEFPIYFKKRLHIPSVGNTTNGMVQSGCFGDSGGPLVSYAKGRPVVVAVVSYGSVDCLSGLPVVSTRIVFVRSWLTSMLDVVEIPVQTGFPQGSESL